MTGSETIPSLDPLHYDTLRRISFARKRFTMTATDESEPRFEYTQIEGNEQIQQLAKETFKQAFSAEAARMQEVQEQVKDTCHAKERDKPACGKSSAVAPGSATSRECQEIEYSITSSLATTGCGAAVDWIQRYKARWHTFISYNSSRRICPTLFFVLPLQHKQLGKKKTQRLGYKLQHADGLLGDGRRRSKQKRYFRPP